LVLDHFQVLILAETAKPEWTSVPPHRIKPFARSRGALIFVREPIEGKGWRVFRGEEHRQDSVPAALGAKARSSTENAFRSASLDPTLTDLIEEN
jgi:hypothetical protein